MKKKFRNIFSVFLSILMFLSVFFDAFGNMEKTFANSDIITDIQLDKEEFKHAQSFKVMVRFGGKGTKVKEGQQEEIRFLSDKVNIILPSSKITLENSQGINLGTVLFQDRKAVVTFNKKAESLEDVEGEFNFSVFGYYDGDKTKDGEGSIELINNRIHKKIKLIYKRGQTVTDEVYSKKGVWSTRHPEGNRLEWVFRFNAAKKEAKSTGGGYYRFKVIDDLPSTMVWDIESINKNPYILELNGERWISIVEAKNMGFKIDFDRQNLVIEIPNWVHQNSTYLNPLDKRELTIRLMAKVKDEVMKNKSITHVHNSSNPELQNLDWQIDPSTISDSVEIIRQGGWATGTKPGELKIKKVIKGTQTPIEGVKFKLSRSDGKDVRVEEGPGYVYKNSVILTTNHEGIASTKGLEYAEYTLEEIEVPEWIKFDENNHFKETFLISGNDREGKEYTIENEKKKINVNVKKKWLDSLGNTLNEYPETKVQLYQNNNPIQGEVTLKRNNLEHIWRDLDFSDDQGNKYEYSVKEVGENNKKIELEGKIFNVDYSKEFTESNENFTIINKEDKPNPKEGKGKFIINKTDGKKALDGAVFELKNNSNQSVIVPSSGEGSSKISYGNLDPGTYTLKEKTPPAGYEKTNQEWEVTVDKDGFTKVEEKSIKLKKTNLKNPLEESSGKQFRSANPSSYILPKSLRVLYRIDRNGYPNFVNKPAHAGELDINQLYPKDNYPNPSFSYSVKDVTKNKRKNEKYKSTNEGDWYKYRGTDKYYNTDVAEVNKYLVPTDKPGEYEVHLKVRGNTIEEKNSLGIVVVYDNSGSMGLKPYGWNRKRFEVAKEATEGFLREILNPNNNNVQAALVTFGGDLFDGQYHKEGWYDDNSHLEFTNNPESIINKMPRTPTSRTDQRGGTYTAFGLKKAEELLRNSRFDNKVIITITDGIPTFSPAIEYAKIPKLNYEQKYGNGSRFPLYNGSYNSYDGVWIKDHGQATIYQAQINKNAGIDMYTVGILIAAEKGASEKDAHNVMRGIANPDKYFNSNEIGDIKKNLGKILVDLNHKTVNEGEINDPLGSQVEYNSNSGYELKKYRNGIEASDVSTRARVEYDNFNRKFKVSNLNLGKDESCELIYKVNLKIDDSNFVSGYMNPTNGEATLKPYGDKNVSWKFPEPAISATLKNIKLKKRWQNQSEKTSNDEITFQLQSKIKGQGDGEYKDVANKYIRKKIKDISNTEFTHTFKDLIPFNNNGEIYEYRVIEKGVPNGYDSIIDTDGEGNTNIINREIPVVKVKNKPNNVEFTKVNSIGAPLGGATFKLQKRESHTWKDVEKYKNITSNNLEGEIRMEKLAPGDYRLIETKAPQGFITPDENSPVATFTVDNNGKISSKSTNNNDENKIVNYPQDVDLKLFKYEGNESAQRPLRGAIFKIYKNDSRPDKNNPTEEVIIKGVSEWMTNGDGEVTISGLGNGTYWLREIKPPEGYERIEGFVGKIIVKDGNISYKKQPLYNDKGTKPENIQDNKIELKQNILEIQNKKNYIELEKCYKDSSGREQPLNGAKFGLYKKENEEYKPYKREGKHYTVLSGDPRKDGKFRFEQLEPGKYAVREEEAPLGFEKIDGNIITFTVSKNGDYVDIENIQHDSGVSNNVCKIINRRKPMKFYIIKTDSNGLKLSDGILGVKIERLKFNNGKDKKEFNLASDYVDYSSSEGLKSGLEIEVPLDTKTDTYILKETRAPQGFQLSNKEYKIRIDSENRRIKLLGDKEHAEQILYEENSSNSTIQLGSPIEIKNKRVEYPNTGGLGTLLFTVIGGGLMVMSSIFIIRKRRRI